jgi:hypothetical protein
MKINEEKHSQKSPILKDRSEHLRIIKEEKLRNENEEIGKRILAKYFFI